MTKRSSRYYDDAFIYVIRGENGRVKIGISSNPKKRFQLLQNSSSEKLLLVEVQRVTGKNARKIEKTVHNQLKQYRLSNTEWFSVSNDIAIATISSVINNQQLSLEFQYKTEIHFMSKEDLKAYSIEMFGKRGWKHRVFECLGVDRITVYRWETGEVAVPGPVTACFLSWIKTFRQTGERPPRLINKK